MICISTQTANTSGSLLLKEQKKTYPEVLTARVKQEKTLDGGAELLHYGFSDGDRQLQYLAPVTENQWLALKALFEEEIYLNISFEGEFKPCCLEQIKNTGNKADIKILLGE